MIDEELVSAIEGHPALDHIHAIPRKRLARALKNPAAWANIRREFGQFMAEVKAMNYDVALDTQSLFKTSAIAYAAGIKRRIGYGHGRELSGLFLNERHFTREQYFDQQTLHLDHLAGLAAALGCSDIKYEIEAPNVPPETHTTVQALLQSGFADNKPVVAIAPGTQWCSKLWAEEYWVRLIDKILNETDLNVLLVGSQGDQPLCARILQAFSSENIKGRAFDISGKTNIPEMYALYAQVAAAIGADSAPQHIAGAVKTPCIVALHGPTSPLRTPPFGSPFVQTVSLNPKLPCQPCHKKTCAFGTNECLTRISPEAVFEELIRGLRQQNIAFSSKLLV